MKNKNVIKVMCISLITIIIGGIITLTAAYSGGTLSISQSRYGIFSFIEWSDGTQTTHESNAYTSDNEITTFKATIDYGSIEINRGATFKVSTEKIKKSDISVTEKNGIYHFNVSQKNIKITGNNDNGKIYVTLPDTVTTVDINQSLGEIDITDLSLKTLTISSAMGDVDLENVYFEEANITLDLGDFDFYGDFTKNFILNNHMGDADIELLRNHNEYNYSLKVNMGEININDYEHDHDNISPNYHHNNDKEATINVKLDMGSLEIENESHH